MCGVGMVGGWRTQPVFPYVQREAVSRREGRGHTALLYSHRYRGRICIAASQRREREGEKREREGGDRERASCFSDVESACECDACVDRVGNIQGACSYEKL